MIPASVSRTLRSLALVLMVAALAACSGGGGSATGGVGGTGAGGMGGTAGVAAGKVLHVVPGTVATAGADGSELKPFATLQLALAAVAASPGWDGTFIMHAGRHEFAEEVILPLTGDLQIMAGATLALGPTISFHCFRDVKVMGTEAAPVLFTWLTPGMHWGSFTLFGVTAQSSEVTYAIFEHSGESQYGGIGVRGGLSLADASAHINHCIFRNAEGDDGLNMKRSGSIIENSLFENNCCDAFDADGASAVEAQAFNNILRNNGNDGFDIGEGAHIRIHHNVIMMNGDKGISNGDGSKAMIDHNLIVGCSIGIGIKDDSDPIATNNTLYGNIVGLRGYHHVDPFGPGK
ncbi:MAG TPA: right-handed parallel beta-helix repeat-containing protein, partial [Polyangia bacterium]|nr:right-handed parallel beta-helix repeat-containing protein [Polyangia bacterium]